MIYRRVSECIQPSTPSAINHTEASIEECSDFFCALNNRFSIFSVVWHLPGTCGTLMFVKIHVVILHARDWPSHWKWTLLKLGIIRGHTLRAAKSTLFANTSALPKYLKDNIYNRLHLVRKSALLEAYSFALENCSHLGTDNDRGQISVQILIFSPNGSHCLYIK